MQKGHQVISILFLKEERKGLNGSIFGEILELPDSHSDWVSFKVEKENLTFLPIGNRSSRYAERSWNRNVDLENNTTILSNGQSTEWNLL